MTAVTEIKFFKYQQKLQNCNDDNKKEIYQRKINLYNKKMKGGEYPQQLYNHKLIKLMQQNSVNQIMKPTVVQDPRDYNLIIEENSPIIAFGYGAVHEKSKTLPMIFQRPPLGDNDVLFEILFCGICHSDWHVLLNEWNNTKYPIITGHEMTGKVIEIGKNVTKFKIADRVCLSPLFNSCRNCTACNNGEEQYCLNNPTETYNMPERLPIDKTLPTGPITQGGYSNIMVAHEYFLFKLPDNLPFDKSAPLLCAGMTVYNALKALNPQPGQTLGIAGIGGLGHLLIKIAKIMGLKVVALTTTKWKLEDSKKLGADVSVRMKDLETLNSMNDTIDFIIDTIPFKHDLDPYLKLLKIHGTISVVGAFYCLNPDFNWVIRKGKIIRGSNIASVKETTEFLNFCSKNNVLPEIELVTFDQINNTRDNLVKSKARYRYVIDIKRSIDMYYK